MKAEPFECTYEKLIPFKSIPFWLFWSFLGAALFVITEALAQLNDEESYRGARLSAGVLIAIMPISFVWFSRAFQKTMPKVAHLLWSDEDRFSKWLNRHLERAFTLSTRPSKLFVALVVILGNLTLVKSGSIYTSVPLNIAAHVESSFMFAIGAQVMYLLFYVLVLLRKIARLTPKIPFFMIPHPDIESLQRIYWVATFLATIGYVILAIGAWFSPVGLSAVSLVWLTFIAFFPLSMFFWSAIQIHAINQQAKESQLELVNREVQRALITATEKEGPEQINRLDGIMNIQMKVQTMRVWPIEWRSTITFLVALLLAVAQIAVAINALRSL